ncbi:MAG: hypothetical protein IJY61_00345 [Candidatus Gastranaerophilales bacterium]|nr:hypothetical protein [Candidatus Gastranaerophilales bacterium]
MIIQNNPFSNTLHSLDLIAERQKALSCNLANMDTPNYRRKDISFAQYLGAASGSLETALSMKMGPSPVTLQASDEKVNPATELSEMQKNAIMFTVASRRMTSLITEMKTVINMGAS